MSATAAPLDEMGLLRQEIAVLRAQVAWLKQQLFGGGKSESLDRAQLLLKLGELSRACGIAQCGTRHSRPSLGCAFSLGLSRLYLGQRSEAGLDNREVSR